MNLQLFYAPQTCATVPYITLNEAGADFSVIDMNSRRGQLMSPEFLKLNPKHKVPVLVIDGEPLTENVAIQIWIARQFPQAKLLIRAQRSRSFRFWRGAPRASIRISRPMRGPVIIAICRGRKNRSSGWPTSCCSKTCGLPMKCWPAASGFLSTSPLPMRIFSGVSGGPFHLVLTSHATRIATRISNACRGAPVCNA